MDSLRVIQGAAVAASLALASYIGVVYVFNEKGHKTSPASTHNVSREILGYVPSDTLYFFGGTEPAPLQNMLDFLAPQWSMVQPTQLRQGLSQQTDNTPPAARMLTGLFIEYLEALKPPQTPLATLGIGKALDAVFYAVGATPVIRIKLADASAFKAFVNKAEATAQLRPEREALDGHTLKTYRFDSARNAQADEQTVRLAISIDDHYAVITLLTPVETPATRKLILGLRKPEQALAGTTVLHDIAAQYGFHPAYLGYLDHREIIKGLTDPEGNAFGRMLDAVFNKLQSQHNRAPANAPGKPLHEQAPAGQAVPRNPLLPLQTPACRKELMAFAQLWPRTVFGYTKLALQQQPKAMSARLLVENTDAGFMQQLQTVRGFIPAHLRNTGSKPVMGLGIGVNVDALTPLAGQLINGFTYKDYQCAPLAELKKNLLTSNPLLGLSMVSGMAAGVQGISATIFAIDGSLNLKQEKPAPDIHSMDAMLTISSKNPQQLLMLAANFRPGMPPIQLPADGSAVDLPVPLPTPGIGPVKLALKGNHLVVYLGDKAQQFAEQMANDRLAATGLFAFNMDFGKYMRFVSNIALAAEPSPLSDQDKAMLKAMTKMDMQIVESFDLGPEGVSFDADMAMYQRAAPD